jgi:arginyl-tRNA synthetase
MEKSKKDLSLLIEKWLSTKGLGNELSGHISFQPTRKEFEGDITLVVFPFTKFIKAKPDDIANEIGAYLKEHYADITAFNVVKGFLNISLHDRAFSSWIQEALLLSDLAALPSKNEKVMVEFSSPNTNKPLHLGHLRNNFLGDAVARILKAAGYEVCKANLINDRGIHICKSMLAYALYGQGETPESSGLKGDHLVGKYYVRYDEIYRSEVKELIEEGKTEDEAKREAPVLLQAQEYLRRWELGDEEVVSLWKKMNGWVYAGFESTYRNIGVSFDSYYYESNTYLLGKEVVEEGLAKEVFFQKPDGSVWIDLSNDGLDQKLVLRADGTSVYITQDLGTSDLKYRDFPAQKYVYVVGNEQDYHFEVLIQILKKLQRPYANGVYHLSYGMVDLPSGKMKSREGTVVDADQLVAEMLETAEQRTRELGKIEDFSSEEAKQLYHQLAMGALKFYLLKVDPKKRMMFNPEESIEFQGHTGPFIQYTHARIATVLRKAKQLSIEPAMSGNIELSAVERELIRMMNGFPAIIEDAAKGYSPALIANYCFDLAKEFNRFYAEMPILNASAEEMAMRVGICTLAGRTIKEGMLLLGVEVPERM